MVRIEWYEGSQAEEIPKRIVIDNDELFVDEILKSAQVFEKPTQGYSRRFTVRCGSRVFCLTELFGEWNVKEE